MKTVSLKKRYSYNITTVIITVVMLFFVYGCKNKTEIKNNNLSRKNLPRLKAENISTIISDSGITRYRIATPEWLIYDKASEPYWLFPKGITFIRFDELYRIDARLKSNTAKFFDQKSLWELTGNVVAKNIKGELFETEQLFWDEKNERIYSDKKIKITQKTKIITGIGFESNPTLTHYVIRNPQGIIPVDETK